MAPQSFWLLLLAGIFLRSASDRRRIDGDVTLISTRLQSTVVAPGTSALGPGGGLFQQNTSSTRTRPGLSKISVNDNKANNYFSSVTKQNTNPFTAKPPVPVDVRTGAAKAAALINKLKQKYATVVRRGSCSARAPVCQDLDVAVVQDGRIRRLYTDPATCGIIVGEVRCKDTSSGGAAVLVQKPKPAPGVAGSGIASSTTHLGTSMSSRNTPNSLGDSGTKSGENDNFRSLAPEQDKVVYYGPLTMVDPTNSRELQPQAQRHLAPLNCQCHAGRKFFSLPNGVGPAENPFTYNYVQPSPSGGPSSSSLPSSSSTMTCATCQSCECEFHVAGSSAIFNYFNVKKSRIYRYFATREQTTSRAGATGGGAAVRELEDATSTSTRRRTSTGGEAVRELDAGVEEVASSPVMHEEEEVDEAAPVPATITTPRRRTSDATNIETVCKSRNLNENSQNKKYYGRFKVLAIGMGVGWIQQTLARECPDFDILTIEISEPLSQVSKHLFGYEKTKMLGDETSARIMSSSFSTLTSSASSSVSSSSSGASSGGAASSSSTTDSTTSATALPVVGRNRLVISDALAWVEEAAAKKSAMSRIGHDAPTSSTPHPSASNLSFDLMIVDCFLPNGNVPRPSCQGDRFARAASQLLKDEKALLLQNTLSHTSTNSVASSLEESQLFDNVARQNVPGTPNIIVTANKKVNLA
ncbi:unnamed protein product [Amoebophrya sp. A25]|nr:unnamed protein product [Amoebophrya sp. A25]|eukprot:GSA25T00014805001.1